MSKKSESPKTQTDEQEPKATKSSYWLTPEEIKALRGDLHRTLELGRQLRKKKGREIKPYPIEYQAPLMTGPDPVQYRETIEDLRQE